jgi:hypothetical protein
MSVLSHGLTGDEYRVYEYCTWVTDDIQFWIGQPSTSHYAPSVLFFCCSC